MGAWGTILLAACSLASSIVLWAKRSWRSERRDLYNWGPLIELGQIEDWDAWVNGHVNHSAFLKLPFTPTLPCEPGVSKLLDRFDWKVAPLSSFRSVGGCRTWNDSEVHEITFKGDPRSVWAVPTHIPRLLELCEQYCDPKHNDRVVYFGGTEHPLEIAFGNNDAQRQATLARLRKYFRRIAYQTMDIVLEGVHLAPMGLSWGYMYTLWEGLLKNSSTGRVRSPRLQSRAFANTLANASDVELHMKTRGVLGTLSHVASWLDTDGTLQRAQAHAKRRPFNLIFPTKTNSSVRSILKAWECRARLRGWAASPAAKIAGVDFRSFPSPEYWRELPKYKFLLNPMGSAIQTAKTYEALLVLTVPIVMHMGYEAFFELRRMGFPLALVDAWGQVTPRNLSRWWGELSPRLVSFRRNCLTVDGYWKLITGVISVCQ